MSTAATATLFMPLSFLWLIAVVCWMKDSIRREDAWIMTLCATASTAVAAWVVS